MSNRFAKAYNMVSVLRCLGASGGNWEDAERFAAANLSWNREVVSVVKAAASSTGVGDLGDSLVGGMIQDAFIEALRSVSAFDAMASSMRGPVPARMQLLASSGVVGGIVPEGGYAPVSELALSDESILPVKAQALVVLSSDAYRNENLQPFLQRELTLAVSAATNGYFLPALADVATPETSSGSTAAHVFTDVEKLLKLVNKTGSSELFLVVSPDHASALSCKHTNGVAAFPDMTPNGGTVCGIRTLVSDQLPEDSDGHQVLLIDADGIVRAEGGMSFARSTAATIRMSTAPETDVAPAEVSLFQNDLTAVLAARQFGFRVVRSNVAAVLTGVAW